MDYDLFFQDVATWIKQSNHNQLSMGFGSDQFWDWVTTTSGELCNKYNNAPLVIKQFDMLVSHLEGAYKGMEGR